MATKMRKSLLLSTVFATFCGAPAFAKYLCGEPYNSDCVAPGQGVQTETRFVAGLQWNFGDSQPELVLAVRRTETMGSSEVLGGKLDVAIPLRFDMNIKPVVRLLGVAGDRDVQGEYGFGFQAFDMKPLLAIGMQAPFTNIGVNYLFGDGYKPYVGLNSFQRAVAPKQNVCPAGYTFMRATPNVEATAIVNGYTCENTI